MILATASDLDLGNGVAKIDSRGELIAPGPLSALLSADRNRPRTFRPAASRSVFDLTDKIGAGVITMVASEHRHSRRPVRFRLNLFAADGHEVPVQGQTWWDDSLACWIVDGLERANRYGQRNVTPPRLGVAPQAL